MFLFIIYSELSHIIIILNDISTWYWLIVSIHVWAQSKFIGIHNLKQALFVSLLVCGLSFHSRILHSFGDVIISGEGLKILAYARNSWSLSSEGALTCHTYCDTGHRFKMVISEDTWQSHLLPSFWQCSCRYLFLIRTPNTPLARRTL